MRRDDWPSTSDGDPSGLHERTVMAERALLSAMMKSDLGRAIQYTERLVPLDFCVLLHQALFRALKECAEKHQKPEVALLGERVAELLGDEAHPGVRYLRRLEAMPEGDGNVEAYVEAVLSLSVRRSLTELLSRGQEVLKTGTAEALGRVMQDVGTELDGLKARVAGRGTEVFGSIAQFTASAIARIESALDKGDANGVIGLKTGFEKLDAELLGMQPGDLVVLAARPSMGKTTLAQNIADHVSTKEQTLVLMFSIEMGGHALAMRSISAATGIDNRRLRSGRLRDEEWSDLVEAAETSSRRKLWIDTRSGVTPSDIRLRARQLEAKLGERVGLVVIDYLQLMSSGSGTQRPGNRNDQVGEISRGLKAVAKDLGTPVLALSQLNRTLEMRPDKRPVLADLRESGQIEQDADVVLMIYRDDYYNENSPTPGQAEIIIAKHREAPTGVVNLRFNTNYLRFEDLT